MNFTTVILVDAVAAGVKESGIKKRDVEAILENIINIIQDTVSKGEKVQLVGFGTFERRERGERTMKNPRTGEDMQVAPSKSPVFSAGSVFKEKVNN